MGSDLAQTRPAEARCGQWCMVCWSPGWSCFRSITQVGTSVAGIYGGTQAVVSPEGPYHGLMRKTSPFALRVLIRSTMRSTMRVVSFHFIANRS